MKKQQFKMPPPTVLEKDIEGYLYRACKKQGWLCEKFTSPNKRSVPDRIVSLPGGRVVFVELKAPGKKPTELQLMDHKIRGKLGHVVFVIDTKPKVDQFINLLGRIVRGETNDATEGV